MIIKNLYQLLRFLKNLFTYKSDPNLSKVTKHFSNIKNSKVLIHDRKSGKFTIYNFDENGKYTIKK